MLDGEVLMLELDWDGAGWGGYVLQTEAGALERWGVRVADQLDIREVE